MVKKPKRPTYPASTRKGFLQLLVVLNMAWAVGEAAFLVLRVWLGGGVFQFRATGATLSALQCAQLAALLAVHGVLLFKLTFSARYHRVFAAELVLFPLAHALNFLAVLALLHLRRGRQGRGGSGDLTRPEFLSAWGAGYAALFLYALPAWCALYGEYKRRFDRRAVLVAAAGGEETRRTRRRTGKGEASGLAKRINSLVLVGAAGARSVQIAGRILIFSPFFSFFLK